MADAHELLREARRRERDSIRDAFVNDLQMAAQEVDPWKTIWIVDEAEPEAGKQPEIHVKTAPEILDEIIALASVAASSRTKDVTE